MKAVVVGLLVMCVVVLSNRCSRGVEAWEWPDWLWCFPECLLRKNCFYVSTLVCNLNDPQYHNFFSCINVALDYCSLAKGFFPANKIEEDGVSDFWKYDVAH